ALNNLASNALALARHHERYDDQKGMREALVAATEHGHEALALARSSGNTHRETIALANLAAAAAQGHDSDTAMALIEQYRQLAHEHHYRALELSAELDRATLLRRQNRHLHAVLRPERVLALAADF